MLLVIAAVFAIGCAISICISHDWADHAATPVDRPFSLSQAKYSDIESAAVNGDCAAAYKLAQHHLYSTLQMDQAEKYYRIAAKCANPEALVGLITVLRKPEYDPEIDKLIASLKKLDSKKGAEAADEVALRRAERATH